MIILDNRTRKQNGPFGNYHDSVNDMVVAVVAVDAFYVIVNANAAAFADTGVFVNDGSFNQSTPAYAYIRKTGFGVPLLLNFRLVIVGAHADYPVQA